MAKERREASDSGKNCPYSRPPQMEQRHVPRKAAADDHQKLREWEEAKCPICMEHPYNAVLLQCSSPGCRPYVCNTGVRHSNCLQELYKNSTDQKSGSTIACPLCRGLVHEWDVIDSAARKYMDSKPRSCLSSECNFSGSYAELRKHVRSEHPYAMPRDVDPSRQNKWETMEQERMIGDLLGVLLEEDQGIGDNPTSRIELMITLLTQYNAIVPPPSRQVLLARIRIILRIHNSQGFHNEERAEEIGSVR